MSTMTTKDQIFGVANPEAGETRWFTTSVGAFIRNAGGIVTQLTGGTPITIVADITDPSPKLNAIEGATEGSLILAVEVVGSGSNIATLYQWDLSGGAENVPFTVDGLGGGLWVAIAGRFINGAVDSSVGAAYTPGDADDWEPTPTTVVGALDQLAARGDTLRWGNASVSGTTTTRFLSGPGYSPTTAPTSELGQESPRAGTIRSFSVRHRVGNGNGGFIVYTLRINGIDTTLTVSIASTSIVRAEALGAVVVAATDVLSVGVTKAGSVNSSPTDIQAKSRIA